MNSIRRTAVVAALAATALLTVTDQAQAQRYYDRSTGNEIRFRGGVFTPEGGKGYWDDSFRDFRGDRNDFQGGTIGVDYLHEIGPFMDLLLGSTYYYADHDLAYRDFEDERGHSIFHTTRIQTASFDAGLRFRLAPRQAPIVPYVGGGGTAISYELEEEGDFVNFNRNPPRIFRDRFRSQDVAYGWFAVAGLEIPLNRGFAVFAEGRYQDADANLTDDFDEGFGRLNLTGTSVMVGASWRF